MINRDPKSFSSDDKQCCSSIPGCLSYAMAYVPVQTLETTFTPEAGIINGTIFPELEKPFCGRTLDRGIRRGNKVSKDYAIPFAAWELRLYLDTHPCDEKALAMYKQLCNQCPCQNNYACLPENEYSCNKWQWINDPWPWEYEANCSQPGQSCNLCRQQSEPNADACNGLYKRRK